ncbi:MAG: DNA-binding domain-containing protein [Microcystis aeruginosa LL13-06]|nr:DNA-binding domain-containing protein [Microcystis aeruginosa LL13-06]
MGKPQIAVRIPPPLLAELNQYVERVGTSKTDVIVSAIAAYLGCAETVPLSQRVAELETKVKELQVLLKARFIGDANE